MPRRSPTRIAMSVVRSPCSKGRPMPRSVPRQSVAATSAAPISSLEEPSGATARRYPSSVPTALDAGWAHGENSRLRPPGPAPSVSPESTRRRTREKKAGGRRRDDDTRDYRGSEPSSDRAIPGSRTGLMAPLRGGGVGAVHRTGIAERPPPRLGDRLGRADPLRWRDAWHRALLGWAHPPTAGHPLPDPRPTRLGAQLADRLLEARIQDGRRRRALWNTGCPRPRPRERGR